MSRSENLGRIINRMLGKLARKTYKGFSCFSEEAHSRCTILVSRITWNECVHWKFYISLLILHFFLEFVKFFVEFFYFTVIFKTFILLQSLGSWKELIFLCSISSFGELIQSNYLVWRMKILNFYLLSRNESIAFPAFDFSFNTMINCIIGLTIMIRNYCRF